MNNWKWLGHKQHFICADRCKFSLATLIPNGLLISTVGEFHSNPEKEMETIGAGYYYETFVFKTTKDKILPCGCPEISSYTPIDTHTYQKAKEAQDGHYEICLKFENEDMDELKDVMAGLSE